MRTCQSLSTVFLKTTLTWKVTEINCSHSWVQTICHVLMFLVFSRKTQNCQNPTCLFEILISSPHRPTLQVVKEVSSSTIKKFLFDLALSFKKAEVDRYCPSVPPYCYSHPNSYPPTPLPIATPPQLLPTNTPAPPHPTPTPTHQHPCPLQHHPKWMHASWMICGYLLHMQLFR